MLFHFCEVPTGYFCVFVVYDLKFVALFIYPLRRRQETYTALTKHADIKAIKRELRTHMNLRFDVCFCDRYVKLVLKNICKRVTIGPMTIKFRDYEIQTEMISRLIQKKYKL